MYLMRRKLVRVCRCYDQINITKMILTAMAKKQAQRLHGSILVDVKTNNWAHIWSKMHLSKTKADKREREEGYTLDIAR